MRFFGYPLFKFNIINLSSMTLIKA